MSEFGIMKTRWLHFLALVPHMVLLQACGPGTDPKAASRVATPEPPPVRPALPRVQAATSAPTADALASPLEEVKAWWATCIGEKTSAHESCEEDSRCLSKCEREAYGRLDKVQFATLDLEKCRNALDPEQFEANCRAVLDYVEGRAVLELPRQHYGPFTNKARPFPPVPPDTSWPIEPLASHKAQAHLAVIEARCSLLLLGSRSCAELADVLREGGYGGNAPLTRPRYALSSDERSRGTSVLNRVWPKMDDVLWADLSSWGHLSRCQKPARSKDCDAIANYLKSFPNGHHASEATGLLKASEKRRSQLAAQEAAEAAKEMAARDRYWQSTEGQSKIQQCNVCMGQCKANGSADYECHSRCSSLCPLGMPR